MITWTCPKCNQRNQDDPKDPPYCLVCNTEFEWDQVELTNRRMSRAELKRFDAWSQVGLAVNALKKIDPQVLTPEQLDQRDSTIFHLTQLREQLR